MEMKKLNQDSECMLGGKRGFTLVELMITIVVAGIISVAVYAAYTVQQHNYQVQEVVAEMQQNLRAVMLLISRDIRMAGLDPDEKIGLGIITAQKGRLSIRMDINGDGDVADSNEVVDFGFSETDDSDNDGLPDRGSAVSLGRQVGGAGGYQPVADNIQAVEFSYILDDGSVTANPVQTELNRIRSVQLSVLARAGRPDTKFTNTMSYKTASGATWGPFDDHFRRRLLVATIHCRNMGM